MAILGLINGMGGKEEMVTDKRDLREKENKSKCGPCFRRWFKQANKKDKNISKTFRENFRMNWVLDGI